jgi:hypothetical protein
MHILLITSSSLPARPEVLLYEKRHKIEDSLGWIKDWRRIATRYNQYAHTFFSSTCIAASHLRRMRPAPSKDSLKLPSAQRSDSLTILR